MAMGSLPCELQRQQDGNALGWLGVLQVMATDDLSEAVRSPHGASQMTSLMYFFGPVCYSFNGASTVEGPHVEHSSLEGVEDPSIRDPSMPERLFVTREAFDRFRVRVLIAISGWQLIAIILDL